MKIGDSYKELVNEEAGHKYGCVMLFLDVPNTWWENITDEIDNTDAYIEEGDRTYGIQPSKKAHVTILYGLHADVPDEQVEALIDNMVAPEITLKKISIFDKDKNFDVVKFDVEGDDLFKMNKAFAELPHTTDYPDYHPHVTLAYVKAGTGKKYVKSLSDDNKLVLKPNKVVYSKANGEEKEYYFK